MLIRAGLVNGELIERAASATHGSDQSWLEYLVQRKLVSEDEVAALAARETFLPLADPDRLQAVPSEIIAEVPWDLAVEHRIVPVGIDEDGDLHLAMLDPCCARTLTEVEFFVPRRLLREVAPATAMAWALHRYYGARTALWPQQAARPTTIRTRPVLHAVQPAL